MQRLPERLSSCLVPCASSSQAGSGGQNLCGNMLRLHCTKLKGHRSHSAMQRVPRTKTCACFQFWTPQTQENHMGMPGMRISDMFHLGCNAKPLKPHVGEFVCNECLYPPCIQCGRARPHCMNSVKNSIRERPIYKCQQCVG